MQSNAVVSEGDFIVQLFVTTQFLYIVLRDFAWRYSGARCSSPVRAPSHACYRKRKPIPMPENLVMPSACNRPPRTHWQGGTSRFRKGGTVNPRHAAYVCLGETLTSSPRGSQWSFYRKDIEFFLSDSRPKTSENIVLRMCFLLSHAF